MGYNVKRITIVGKKQLLTPFETFFKALKEHRRHAYASEKDFVQMSTEGGYILIKADGTWKAYGKGVKKIL